MSRRAEAIRVARGDIERKTGGTLHHRFGWFGELVPSREAVSHARRNMQKGRRH